jgi:hypothetical protein
MREVALRAVTVLAATLVAFGLAEGTLRMLQSHSGSGDALDYKDARRVQWHEHGEGTGFAGGGFLKEGFEGFVLDGYGGRVRWRNNSQGFRSDEEYAVPKPAGTLRILSLGDSFAAGTRVGQDQTYSFVLQQLLRSEGSFGRVEVLIAVLEEPTMQLEYLRDLGLSYQPDIVLLGVTLGNDFVGAYSTQDEKGVYRLLRGPDGVTLERKPPADDYERWKRRQGAIRITSDCLVPDGHHERGPRRPDRSAPPRLRLLGLIRGLWQADAAQTVISDGGNYLQPRLFDSNGLGVLLVSAPPPMQAAYTRLLAALEGIHDLCEKHDVGLIVALFPQRYQVQPRDWRETVRTYDLRESCFDLGLPSRRILEVCAAKHIECVDLGPALSREHAEQGKSLYLPLGDMHWNARGHAAAARGLFRRVADYAARRSR